MKSVFKIVLNKLRSTFRRSTDQNLDQPHSRESLQDDSEQSNKIKSSRSDSSLGTCSSNILGSNMLGTSHKLGDLIENELKKKAALRGKQPVIRSVSSATCSPRRAPPAHPPIKQYGSNKSTKSIRSFGSTLSNKSVRSVGQLNADERAAASSAASSTTNLHQPQRKNVSGQNSNDTLSTTSSIAMLFNPPQSASYKPQLEQQLSQKLREQQRAGSSQSLLKGDSPDSSSHLSSLADNVPELPNLAEDARSQHELLHRDEDSSYSIKDMDNESESTIFASSPNLYAQSNLQSHQTGQPLLISQSMSMDEPELSDTDSLIGIEIDQAKCRSKSVDASVVIAMKQQSMGGAVAGQKGRPKGSTTFLEIPKFRLFVRKPSNASTTSIAGLGATAASNAAANLGTSTTQPNSQIASTATPTVIKLADIFKDCVHCKWMDLIEPKKVFPVDAPVSDLFSDNNNNTLTESQPSRIQSLEEEDEELSSDLDSEELDECQHSHFASTSLFQGNDFSSTAVYHQQQSQHASSSVASSSGARRYVKNRQRRSSYNVTYFSRPPANLQQPAIKQPPAIAATPAADRPSSAAGFVKKSDDKPSDEQSDKANSDNKPKIFPSLPSVTLDEASDDEKEKDAINDLIAATAFGTGETMCISIQITEPTSCCEAELEDPGSGITVVSLEVPVLNSGKQARSASVDSSFLQVPQRTDIDIGGELPPSKTLRSRSVDISLPCTADGPYLGKLSALNKLQTPNLDFSSHIALVFLTSSKFSRTNR